MMTKLGTINKRPRLKGEGGGPSKGNFVQRRHRLISNKSAFDSPKFQNSAHIFNQELESQINLYNSNYLASLLKTRMIPGLADGSQIWGPRLKDFERSF